MAQGEMECIGEEVIDGNLTLLLARGSGIPRVGIFNTKTNKKKYVCFSWLEGDNKSLKIKLTASKTQEYSRETLMKGVFNLIQKNEDALSLKTLMWRGVQIINDLIHMPKAARTEVDAHLIGENKRDTLWFAYTPKDDDWLVRPSFIADEHESRILESHLEDGVPWRGLPLEKGALPVSMRNMPVPRELFNANPERWSAYLPDLSKCMLLGFSDWSPNEEHTFCDALWEHLSKANYRSEDSLTSLASSGRQFVTSLTAYLRLWPVCQRATIESVHDSIKEGDARGFKKKERYQMIAAHLGDKRFNVTKYVGDNNIVAFGIVPETRLPGEQDRMVVLDNEGWDASLDACSLGGEKDPQYTCVSLIRGIDTKAWFADISSCISGDFDAGGKANAK